MGIFERLRERAEVITRTRVAQLSDRLAKVDLPRGIVAQRSEQGIALSGKRLRRRLIDDVRLRSFADLVKENLR